MLRRSITVRFRVQGVHCWPEASDDIGFLREPHRHLFCYTVTLGVSKDRQYEFFQLQDVLRKWVNKTYPTKPVPSGFRVGPRFLDFESRSCENLAEELGQWLVSQGYGIFDHDTGCYTKVSVFEDNENGATWERDYV